MSRVRIAIILAVVGGWGGGGAAPCPAGLTVTFDELSVYTETTAKGSYFNGRDSSATGDYSRDASWSSQGVGFNLTFNRQTFGGTSFEFWNGWAYSNVNDTTTPGFANQYAAFPGLDHSGSGNRNYAVAFPQSIIDLPVGLQAASVAVAITTYTALYIRDGDAGGFDPPGPYGATDYFDVVFTGYAAPGAGSSSTGQVKFRLAEGPNPITGWEAVDLSGLNAGGTARSIAVSFESSDVGAFGINTPTYVAIDSLALADVAAVPEPSAGLLLAAAACVLMWRRRSVAGLSDRPWMR